MKGINGYSKPGLYGGVIVDVEGMMADLVTVVKADGKNKEEFLEFAGEVFDAVVVKVKYPQNG